MSEIKKTTLYLNKGVNRDSPPGALEDGFASDLRHMRFDDGVSFKMPGITKYIAAVGGSQINGLYSFADHAGVIHLLQGEVAEMNISAAAAAMAPFSGATNTFTGALKNRWSFAAWGAAGASGLTILMTNGVNKPQKLIHPYVTAGSDLTDMSADAACPAAAGVVRVYQRHVFLLGDTANLNRVSWSDIDTYVIWTPTAANDAGSIDLYESKTPVVGGDTLKMMFVVYTGNQIHTFQYIGGTYVFARQIADYSTGLWSRDLLVSTEDAQFFMSPTNFYAFDGTRPQPIGKGIRKEVYKGIAHAIASHSANIDFSFAFHVRDKGEVWFCVPTNSAYPDLACVFNYWNGAWSLEDFATGSLACAGIDQSPQTYPLIALSDHGVYSLGSGENKALVAGDATAFTGYIDTPEFEGDEPEAVKHILKIVPDITATAGINVGVRVGTRDTRNSAITWTPALADAATSFDPDVDKHIDVRVSGRLGRVRIETSALASPFQVNKVSIYYVQEGDR